MQDVGQKTWAKMKTVDAWGAVAKRGCVSTDKRDRKIFDFGGNGARNNYQIVVRNGVIGCAHRGCIPVPRRCLDGEKRWHGPTKKGDQTSGRLS